MVGIPKVGIRDWEEEGTWKEQETNSSEKEERGG